MPGKIDARSFNYAKQADSFLSLTANDTPATSNATEGTDSASTVDPGQAIWRDISGNPDAVSSYIICLIAKLISLDSGHASRPLPEVYKEITELQVDVSKYKAWCNKEKPIPSAARPKAVRLQQSIVGTIYFLKQFYGFSPNPQLRNMYLRWSLARNQIASPFETEVLSSVSGVGSKDIPTASSPFLSCEINEEKLVKELINDCYHHHRRNFFGSLPSETCKLTINQSVSSSLSYVRLKDLISRSPGLLRFAMDQVVSLIQTGVSHTQDYGEREVLLPLLRLLKECLTMMVDVDYQSLYKTLMPFYTWPVSHSDTIKELLGILLIEKKARGTLYRRTILQEHQLDLNLRVNRPKPTTVVMLIDTSGSGNHGNKLYQSMIYHQEKPPTLLIKRLLLSSVFHSLAGENEEQQHQQLDISKADMNICKLSEEALTTLCEEGIDITEQAVAMETTQEANEFLKVEIESLYKKMTTTLEQTLSEEQEDHEHYPTSFLLPPPYIPVYELDHTHFSALCEKLQDVLTRLQKPNESSAYPTINMVDSLGLSYPPPSNQTSLPSNQSHNSLTSCSSLSIEEFNSATSDKVSDNLYPSNSDTNLMPNGGGSVAYRSISPTARSDPGMGLLIKPTKLEPLPLSPLGSKHSPLTSSQSLSLQVGGEGDGFGDTASQDSDRTSDSGSKISEEVGSRVSMDSTSTHPPCKRRLERRHTESFTSGSRKNLSLRGSAFYPNQVVSPTSSLIGSIASAGSRGSVKQRANPSASGTLRVRRANTISRGVAGGRSKGRTRKVKILLAGDDYCVSNMAKAYAHLHIKEPNLFSSLDIEFLYIPLSKAVIGSGDQTPSTVGGVMDLPESGCDMGGEESGRDVLIGQYLSHVDSWYEQNVMLAVHNSLRILMNDSNFVTRSYSMLEGLDTRWLPPPTPSRVMVNMTANFLREATHTINTKIFRVKMTLRSDKAAKGFENRESYMFHKIDIQRLSGKKCPRMARPYEASVALTELSLDNSFIKSDLVQMKDVWIIRGSNIPHPWDLGVPNPENECFELTIVKVSVEGSVLSTKYRVHEELQHHVYEMVVESGKEKPLSVVIDNDTSAITENVIRVELSPAYIDQAVAGSSLRRTERQERQLNFPMATFWPADL